MCQPAGMSQATRRQPRELGAGHTCGADSGYVNPGLSKLGKLTRVTFAAVNDGYRAPTRVLPSLVPNADGTLTMTRNTTGEQLVLSNSGQLLREVDRNGYVVTPLAGDTSGGGLR
jgi:hypothetical protein